MNNQVTTVVMLPDLSTLLRQYQRLSYTPWSALSEFIDNSTESWFQNKQLLIENDINSIKIDITYDKLLDQVVIYDSAYGMELEDFKRAVILGSKPKNKGRNQYGFGLKTAACWLGNKWEVHSTQFGSPNMYSVVVDIDEIERSNTNQIDISQSNVDVSIHETKIIIHNVGQRLKDARIKNDIVQNLTTKYKRDITSDTIRIYFNGIKLEYDAPKILFYQNKEWKRDVNFEFSFLGQTYYVSGFVAILAEGNKEPYKKTGFALFTDNRTIIGGYNTNYKPIEIFTNDSKGLVAGKLFGEINLDNIELNQAKDGYVWGNGLESFFVNELKRNIQDYITIAGKKHSELKDKVTTKEDISTNDTSTPVNSENNNKSVKNENEILENLDATLDLIVSPPGLVENHTRTFEYLNHGAIKNKIYIKFTDQIEEQFNLNSDENILLINNRHNQFKNALDKSIYLKQCICFALIKQHMSVVYSTTAVNFSVTFLDIQKRFFEVFNSLKEV